MKTLALLFFLTGSALASEADSFSVRDLPFVDITTELNQEIQRRMDLALERANRYNKCNPNILRAEMGKVLRGGFVGQVENWVNTSELFQYKTELENSIYQDSNLFDGAAIHLTNESLGSVIMLNNEMIGTDKLGHFFDEGWHLHRLYKNTGKLTQSFRYSEDTEKGFFGLMATGVESFADKVANFQGMMFWNRLIKDAYPRISQDWFYYSCEDNQFVANRSFDWADYVDGAWDETINCNNYVKTMGEKVYARLSEMNMSCPMDKNKCQEAVIRYGEHKKHLIHPDCINAAE